MWNIDVSYREEFQSTFDRLYDKLAVLNKNRPLPYSAISKIKESLSIEWTYNSNSIEGNTLSLRETQMVLQDGIPLKENHCENILKLKIMSMRLIIYIKL